ncbi:hypothetical protein ACTXT7_016360 [Hymenolepis weldensis]
MTLKTFDKFKIGVRVHEIDVRRRTSSDVDGHPQRLNQMKKGLAEYESPSRAASGNFLSIQVKCCYTLEVCTALASHSIPCD